MCPTQFHPVWCFLLILASSLGAMGPSSQLLSLCIFGQLCLVDSGIPWCTVFTNGLYQLSLHYLHFSIFLVNTVLLPLVFSGACIHHIELCLIFCISSPLDLFHDSSSASEVLWIYSKTFPPASEVLWMDFIPRLLSLSWPHLYQPFTIWCAFLHKWIILVVGSLSSPLSSLYGSKTNFPHLSPLVLWVPLCVVPWSISLNSTPLVLSLWISISLPHFWCFYTSG